MWLEEIVSPSASTSETTRVSNSSCSARKSAVPLAPLPKRKFSPTDTRCAPSRATSTSWTNSSALCSEKPRSNGMITSSSTPSPAIRSRLTGNGLISLGVASGWITDERVRIEGQHRARAADHLAVAAVDAVERADGDAARARAGLHLR